MNRRRKCGVYIRWNIMQPLKEGNPASCNTVDKPGGHYAMWNKPDAEGQIQTDLIYMYHFTSGWTQRTPPTNWRGVTSFASPLEITDTGRGNTVRGEKEEKQPSQDSPDTTLLAFAMVRIYSHTVTHPQHQPQGPSLIDCSAQWRSRSSQKTAKTPRRAGLLKRPFPFLPCPWAVSSSRQQAPKWGFDQWRPGWYW